MRRTLDFPKALFIVLTAAAAVAAGCGGKAESDSAPDAGAGTDATIPVDANAPPCVASDQFLFMGDSLDFSFCAADPQIADLTALYALDPADVVAAFEAADPARAPYDFAGFGSRWAAVRIANPSAMTAARLTSSELDVALLCIEPFSMPPVFHVNDDLAGAAPGAGVDLVGAGGPWDCLATTSPHTDAVAGNTPLGRARLDTPPL
jgi:hypothetical protein